MADEATSEAIQGLRTVHYALVISPLLFALGVTLSFDSMASDRGGSESALAAWVLLGVALVNTLTAPVVRGRMLRFVVGARSEAGAIKSYRTATILFCALLESAALLLLVAALLAGSLMPFVPAVMVPIAVGLAMPPSGQHFAVLREEGGAD